MTSAFDLWRSGLARFADATGLALLGWLAWQVLFGGSQTFQVEALWVGLVGAIACWSDPGAVRKVPWPMLGYAAVGLVATAGDQRHAFPPLSVGAAIDLFTPAFYLVIMAVFVFGGAHLLRTPERLSWAVALFAVAVCVLAGQMLFDRVASNYAYDRMGSGSLPSVAQWAGMHQAGLVLLTAFPIALSVTLLGRAVARVLSGVIVGGWLLVAAYFNGSRSGVVAMAVTVILAVLAIAATGNVKRKWPRAALGILLLVPVGLLAAVFTSATSMTVIKSITGDRDPIWGAAWQMFLDHFWFGVGPGNYTLFMLDGGYASRHLPWYPMPGGVEQAHNFVLQAAAETGVFGVLFLLGFVASMLWGCWKAWRGNHLPLVAFALVGMVGAFFLRCLSDNFIDLAITADRIRVLAWMLFAAAVSAGRLPLTMSRRVDLTT